MELSHVLQGVFILKLIVGIANHPQNACLTKNKLVILLSASIPFSIILVYFGADEQISKCQSAISVLLWKIACED